MSANDRVTDVVGPVVTGFGLALDGVDVSAAGKRRLVRVTLDKVPPVDADGWTTTSTAPLTLDDVAEVSRAVSEALDAADVLGAVPYVLEVSSPGVGRRLREPRHFRRNVGRILEVTTDSGTLTGRVVRADDVGVELRLDPTTGPAGDPTLPYAAITRAAVQVEFAEPSERN
mgnify:CR=1 FL=1|jgi:ribosome maturation factor RimP